MTSNQLRAVAAGCLIAVTVAVCFFAYHKHPDDRAVAEPLERLADKFAPKPIEKPVVAQTCWTCEEKGQFWCAAGDVNPR